MGRQAIRRRRCEDEVGRGIRSADTPHPIHIGAPIGNRPEMREFSRSDLPAQKILARFIDDENRRCLSITQQGPRDVRPAVLERRGNRVQEWFRRRARRPPSGRAFRQDAVAQPNARTHRNDGGHLGDPDQQEKLPEQAPHELHSRISWYPNR
jgi:hypothetical protein